MAKLNRKTLLGGCLAVLMYAAAIQTAYAGPLRDLIKERRAQHAPKEDSQDWSMPTDTQVTRNVSYGSDERQCFDVYAPREAKGAPVIFMVHGGAWRNGDKGASNVVRNKVAHWVPKGTVFISLNYRMLPDKDPLEQARDVARALAAAQTQAAAWGGDRNRFILMGHSAGAHLVAFLTAAQAMQAEFGIMPWKGTIMLDSAALDVVRIMEGRHMRLHDDAFGKDPVYWKSISPFHALETKTPALLAVCSSQRQDSCNQSERFVAKAKSFGTRASVLPQNLSHEEINQLLGQDSAYTNAVDAFIDSL